MWNEIKELLLSALNGLYSITNDYGFAIILLTLFIRLALMPLTIKQTHSMYEMQRIQPKIKELQKKYKDDKQKLQEETLKFYQENKVNPFGGCLPLILQMPVFFALYQVLGPLRGGTAEEAAMHNLPSYIEVNAATLPETAKRFWIILSDITSTPQQMYSSGGLKAVIPYAILVILFGLSIWLPQQLMPGEKQQKSIGQIMAIMMLWFGWISPAGVLLYWVTSSMLGVAQQQIQLRSYARKEGAG